MGSPIRSSVHLPQCICLPKEELVHEPEGIGASVHSPWQGGQRHPSFIHFSFLQPALFEPLWEAPPSPCLQGNYNPL